ncbi:hypothetical protein K488DRAFT_52838 [Vararia minispora EC-137]|uniref:Uncharacterized protein n=1 Tax=Vararia minispora EC-137 TaxID=1314806 RepID=A0ACB8QIE8_9AGAM|nr:hypothetical protein K488DRAFT_52838 [Vararia minispora EC-137]
MQLLTAYTSLTLALATAANPLSSEASALHASKRALTLTRSSIVRDESATCTNPTVVSTQTAVVGNNTVLLEVLACPASVLAANTNGLVANGNVTCGQDALGQLPPTSSDCQVIIESIQIFEGNSSPTFVVDPLHIQQLTFGTCRFFFENLGSVSLEYCWQDLANMGSLAATSCFPPVQPQNTLAICEALDTSWEVGCVHD